MSGLLPYTMDDFNVIIPIVIGLIAVLVIVGAIVVRKSRKK